MSRSDYETRKIDYNKLTKKELVRILETNDENNYKKFLRNKRNAKQYPRHKDYFDGKAIENKDSFKIQRISANYYKKYKEKVRK